MEIREFGFLEGFEKRMQIAAVVDSIVNRRNKNRELESLFEQDQLENLIFSVLVFIMEQTLSENEECTLEDIASFMGRLLPHFGLAEIGIEVRVLAEYIVKDILQNGGEARHYHVMKYGTGMVPLRVRLIDDRLREADGAYTVTYQLTDQGYDFLFRTKEVEQEISLTIEELKLRELIKRKNYGKAIRQSADLVRMIRQKKRDIQQFMLRIRENIFDVDIEDFERIVKSVYDILEEEYGLMTEIRGMTALSEERLREEEAMRGTLDEAMRKARSEIGEIRRNINSAISEQRELIIQRRNLSRTYRETLSDSFSCAMARRFDFEKEILGGLERCGESAAPNLWKLVNPLFRPSPDLHLNVLSLYERQARLKAEDDVEAGIPIAGLTVDGETLKVKRMNDAYVEVLRSLLEFAGTRRSSSFHFREWFEWLKGASDGFQALLEDNLVFGTVLRLYEAGTVDLQAWRARRDDVVANGCGELDIGYCLYRIEAGAPDLFGVHCLRVTNPGDLLWEDEVSYRCGDAVMSRRVTLTDFLFEVNIT